MHAFQICGYSKSGKTTLARELIRRLTEKSFSVASLKDIHFKEFQMDTEGKNTFIHAEAGASPVVARGLKETDFLYSRQLDMLEIVSNLSADYLVVEGYDSFPLPKIVCARTKEEADEFIDKRTFAVAGVLSNSVSEYKGFHIFNPLDPEDIEKVLKLIKEKIFKMLPYVDDSCCGRCGLTCTTMVDAIIQGEKKRSDCKLDNTPVQLKIDGKNIPMVPFVQKILRNVVESVASQLKGWKKGKRIEVVIEDSRM